MKNTFAILILFATIFLLVNCTGTQENNTSDWTVLYRHNAEGKTISGNKDHLIKAVRLGLPVRIGFGGRRPLDTLKSVEHLADAQFLTIANGNEVFAQISPIFGQKPSLDSDTLSVELRNLSQWTMIIGTNGERSTLSRVFGFEAENESKQSNRGATWYVKLPTDFGTANSNPLWD